MDALTRSTKLKILLPIGAIAVAFAAPSVLGALGGSGQVNDVVQLSTTTSTISTLVATLQAGSATGSPVTSGATAFTVTSSGSNVDTFMRYDWSALPYYGGASGQTTINLRGTTYYISDLLWFKQSTLDGSATETASEHFSPLLIKNAASASRTAWTPAGDACTAWAGSGAGGFSAAAAGTFTTKYYSAASQTNDAPLTSDTIHYCLDTTNSWVYLGKSAAFAAATLIKLYTTNSANSVLEPYQYQLLSGSETKGNHYCLVGVTGSGTSATPDLAQCEKLGYDLAGEATAKMFVLWDPPTYFPSSNQNGQATFSMAGTQWNPYASGTTNNAG